MTNDHIGHKRFANIVDHKTTKKHTDRNREKLQCISTRINTSL